MWTICGTDANGKEFYEQLDVEDAKMAIHKAIEEGYIDDIRVFPPDTEISPSVLMMSN